MVQKILLTILGVWLSGLSLYAQIDFTKYFDETSLPLLDPKDHLDLDFKWDMKGNVQVFMNEGINYLKEGNPALAISNFDEVIKLDSLSWISYYYRGVCKKNLFKLDEAKQDFLISKRINPRQAETFVELGEVYHLQNAFNKASSEYEMAIGIDPKLVQAYYNLGSLALEKGDLRRALKYYQKCNEVNPKFPQAYMMQGILKFQAQKKSKESIALFDRAVQADSTYSLTYFWRGLAYVGLGQPQKSLLDWNKLVQFNPENSSYVLMRGCLFIELGNYDNAFNDLRKAMRARAVDEERYVGAQTVLDKRIDLQFAANYLITNGYGLDEKSFGFLKKGFCLLLSGKKAEALENIKRAEEVQPSATVYFIEALTYEHSGDHNLALKYYNMALALDKDIFDAYKKRSVYRSELKDWKGANEDFSEMFRLQPNSPTAYRLRGLAKSNNADYKGAIDDLSKFIKTDSTDYEAIRTRSVCLVMVGDEKAANEDMRVLLKIDGALDLYETVSRNYLALKDTANAIEVWKEYADINPTLFVPRMELARIYIHQKKWDSARVEINRSLPLITPEHVTKKYSEILYWEGLILYEKSDYASAISKFTKSLKYDLNNSEAKYFRAKAYEKTGQAKKAMGDLKDLKTTRYKDSESLYNAVAQQ
jgi:tetratricopeptide (TPR) repeat protein